MFFFALCLKIRVNATLETANTTLKERRMMRPNLGGCGIQQVVLNFSYQVECLSAAEIWLTPSALQLLFQLFRLEAALSMPVNET